VFYTDKSLAPVTSIRPKLRPKKLERKDD